MGKFTGKCMYKGKQVDVEVEFSGSHSSFDNQEQNQIIALLYQADKSKVHQTSKATGVPAGATGYLHVYGTNTLLAIKSYTEGKIEEKEDKNKKKVPTVTKVGKIEFVGKPGSVNKGVHKF